MDTLVQDVRFGLRTLRKAPGFSALAIITFALGVGVNIAIFSVVDAIALRGLAVEDAGRIVRIENQDAAHPDRGSRSSWIELQQFRTGTRAFAAVAAADRRGVIVKQDGEPKLLLANVVSDNYFDVMRVTPAAGRTFTPAELAATGAPPVIVISYDYWQRQFAGDPQIVGRSIVATDLACQVIGVLPRSFRGTELFLNPDVYVPLSTWLAMAPGERIRLQQPQARHLDVFGRLLPRGTPAQAAAALAVLQQQLARQYPEQETGRRLDVTLDADARGSQTTKVSALLLAVASLVLLIACANIANLLIARGEERRAEIATRIALGASRSRTVRQLVTETLLLAAFGGIGAVLLAGWVIKLLPSLMPVMQFSIGFDFRLDARAVTVGALVSLACALIAGILPAIGSSDVAPSAAMKDAAGGGGGRRGRWRDAIVALQIAVTVLLLIGAGLIGRTLIAIRNMDPGFDARGNIVIATVAVRGLKLPQEHAYYRTMTERIGAMPGVHGVAVASRVPLWGSGGGAALQAWVPNLAPADRDGIRLGFAVVSPGYFSALGTRIVRGRAITGRDDETAPLAVVVNQSAAQLLWPDQDAVGKRFWMNGPNGRQIEVVGIAQDGHYGHLTETQRGYVFLPLYQEAQIFGSRWGAEVVMVRTAADAATQAAAIRRAIAAVDQNVLVLGTVTMDEHIRSALYTDRLIAQLIGSMGALALALAAIGLFGVVSHSVTRRTREIGVRVALGAHPRDVLRLVFGHALVLAAIGIAAGVALAFASGSLLSSVLYGVSVHDPLTFGAAVAAMTSAALLAAALPARRAIRVDPIRALRQEL